MERDGGFSWVVIGLLVLLGVGLAYFGFRAYEEARMRAVREQQMRAVQQEATIRIQQQQEEIDRLREEIERARAGAARESGGGYLRR